MDDGRTTDGRTPDHGHPISSPCEPNGSGELKKMKKKKMTEGIHNYFYITHVHSVHSVHNVRNGRHVFVNSISTVYQ